MNKYTFGLWRKTIDRHGNLTVSVLGNNKEEAQKRALKLGVRDATYWCIRLISIEELEASDIKDEP